jgi:hypothetical protein
MGFFSLYSLPTEYDLKGTTIRIYYDFRHNTNGYYNLVFTYQGRQWGVATPFLLSMI